VIEQLLETAQATIGEAGGALMRVRVDPAAPLEALIEPVHRAPDAARSLAV
jgi:hypothetical protein